LLKTTILAGALALAGLSMAPVSATAASFGAQADVGALAPTRWSRLNIIIGGVITARATGIIAGLSSAVLRVSAVLPSATSLLSLLSWPASASDQAEALAFTPSDEAEPARDP
jgi:hypothetical protein